MRYQVPDELALSFSVLLLGHARAYVRSRIRVDPDTGCWIWTGSGDGRYGHAYLFGVRFKAHRLAYLAFVGQIRRGRVVDHKHCDRPPCCCPTHLQAVTQSQNISRCFAVGRGRSPFLKPKEPA